MIKEVGSQGSYEHLVMNEGGGIQRTTTKLKIRKAYYRRIRLVLKTLNSTEHVLIDISGSQDLNVPRKEHEKLFRYKDLQSEITKMWKLNTAIIPVDN